MHIRFTHFLDSGEQGLTVIVLFNDIVPRAGGTYIAPDGIKNVVRWYGRCLAWRAWNRKLTPCHVQAVRAPRGRERDAAGPGRQPLYLFDPDVQSIYRGGCSIT